MQATSTTISPEEIKVQKPYLEWGLSEAEYDYICTKLLHRLPNYTETGLFAVMWSEHCSYKTSKPALRKFWNAGSRVIQGPGEGAGVLDIGDNQAVVFKAESHNHPSYVEPFQGAATGVGGIIRDIFSMGAKPIASLDSLRFGELTDVSNQRLLKSVVEGIAFYGNCIGIPTVGGEIAFDQVYQHNPLVNVMNVGLMDQSDLKFGRAVGAGNAIIYVGAKTGRDGIHGATFASSDFSTEKDSDRSAVQVGDPFMEKLLTDACLKIIHDHADKLLGIQDMGAAGLVSSSAEMAAKAGSGVTLDLNQVPQRETAMTPYEIMLSESQERMLLCVKKGAEATILAIFKSFGLDAVVIGQVTTDNQYQLHHHGELVCDIPVAALVDDVVEVRSEKRAPFSATREAVVPVVDNPGNTLLTLLQQPTIGSKRPVYRQYDTQVQANTMITPGSDAAVVRVPHTQKALAMTMDCNGRYLAVDPYKGGQIAVSEAARNVVASGAIPIGVTNCLNFGNPEDPEVFWALDQAVMGISEACRRFDAPVISGNVSLYNETDGRPIYPTPVIGMVGLMTSVDWLTTQTAKNVGDIVYVIGETRDDFSGSELQKYQSGTPQGQLHFDLDQEVANQQLVTTAIHQGLLQSAHDLSEGGLAVGLAELIMGTQLGLKVALKLSAAQLFSETQSRFVVTVTAENQKRFDALAGDQATIIGHVTATQELEVQVQDGQISEDVAKLEAAYGGALAWLTK